MEKSQKSQKVAQIFECKLCDYLCSKSNDYKKHLTTSKHVNRMKLNGIEPKVVSFICKYCNKCYNARNSLWYHEQKCSIVHKPNVIDKIDDVDKIEDNVKKEDLIMMLLKQNADLMEIVKNGTNNNSNNTINNTNSHNKAFNLNFFLNETCKNAMNITEFVDSIKLELKDLMELGEIGYVASMSKIITKNLNALDETVRPIHCADKKREIFYIKDDDKWEKEDDDLKRLRKIIFRLSNKSYKLLPKYREMFPDYDDSTSIHSDEHCKIIIEAVTCERR
jgi:hypothetical protein